MQYETKVKGVKLPDKIGAQNDDQLVTFMFLLAVLFWDAYRIIFLKEEKH